MRLRDSVALLALRLLTSSASFTLAFEVGQLIQTGSGLSITGKPSSWQSEVSEYLGIPFAQPPINELRWKAPQKYNGNTTIEALQFSVDCPANVPAYNEHTKLDTSGGIVLSSLGQYGDSFGEDCLTLNVWTKPQTGEKKKAVLVWGKILVHLWRTWALADVYILQCMAEDSHSATVRTPFTTVQD